MPSYNSTPMMSYSQQYMGTNSFSSVPSMSASSETYSRSAYIQNPVYDQPSISNGGSSYQPNTFYSDATSTSTVGQSRSYNSLSSANQLSSMNPTSFSTNQNPLYSTPDSFDFSKQSSLVDTDATMRMSYSTPNFYDSQVSDNSAPMDLSNPFSNPSFSTQPLSSQGATPQSSVEDDGGLNFTIPNFGADSNW